MPDEPPAGPSAAVGETPGSEPPPPTAEPPAEVLALAEERRQARERRDFAAADALRDRIAELGWELRDSPAGPVFESLLDRVESFADMAAAPDNRGRPSRHRFSLCMAVHGWPEDVARLLERLAETSGEAAGPGTADQKHRAGYGDVGSGGLELVAVDLAGDLTPRALMASTATGRPIPRVVRVDRDLGQAEALNVAARAALGEIVLFAEPSLSFDASVPERLADALADPTVGATGPFGLVTHDEQSFEPSEAADVEALEYLIAVRRADLRRIGDMDPHFRYYRMLDVDYSHQVAAAGMSVRRVDVPEAEITRHTHRLWESTPEGERERLSRRNWNRFRDRWRPHPATDRSQREDKRRNSE